MGISALLAYTAHSLVSSSLQVITEMIERFEPFNVSKLVQKSHDLKEQKKERSGEKRNSLKGPGSLEKQFSKRSVDLNEVKEEEEPEEKQ